MARSAGGNGGEKYPANAPRAPISSIQRAVA